MPKTKQFDREYVLSQALQLFWQQGYEATSIQEVVSATRLKPGSLYATFGDKHGLFMAVIEHYRRQVIDQTLVVLHSPGSCKTAIQNYFLQLQLKFSQAQHRFGCLMSNATLELGLQDREVAQAISDHLHKLEENFRQVLARGVAQGEISADANLTALARFLTTCVTGISVVSKTTRADEYLSDTIAVILSVLK